VAEIFLTENISKTLNGAIASSCRMLAIREHSEKQLRLKLQKKAYAQDVISACVEYLVKEDWLSDERFCNGFIRSRVEKGQGLRRIAYELKHQNIGSDVIHEQLEREKIDWQALCEKVLEKKIRQATTELFVDATETATTRDRMKPAQRKKLEGFLQYRGFSGDQIARAFSQIVTGKDLQNKR